MMKPVLIEDVRARVDQVEVLRFLGYPAGAEANSRLEQILEPWIEEAARRTTPRAAYVILPVASGGPHVLQLRTQHGTREFSGSVQEFLTGARYVAAVIATAGPGAEALSRDLMGRRQNLAGMIVDAVGTERAEAATTAALEALRQHATPAGFALSAPCCPGQCGVALAEQAELFDLFSGQTAGVRLTSEFLMQPLKSVSGLVGIGPGEHIASDGTACDQCERRDCAMRR